MSKTYKWILAIIVIALVVLGVWYYGSKPTTLAETGPIKIGAILPLTGNNSSTGEAIREGLDIALGEINSKKGQTIEMIYEDSQGDSVLAISAYNKLRNIDGVNYFVVSISGPVLAIAPQAEKDKVILLALGTASPKVTTAGDYIFRHNLLPQEEAQKIAKYLIDQGIKKIPVLVVKAEAGQSYYDFFKKEYETLGGEIMMTEWYEKGAKDYRTNLQKIKTLKAQLVLAFSYPQELALILNQAKENKMTNRWFTTYAGVDPKMLEVAGQNAEGIIFTHYFNPDSGRPEFLKFKDVYAQTYNKTMPPYAAMGYDSLKVMSLVITKCAKDVECTKMALYAIKDFAGATGSIGFDLNGDTRKEIYFLTIKNGQFVPLEK
ncbi:MAG: penicillin-binding protein activator [Candidatus Paceibacterota bacterium]|jgi:branched-chain amino acid transport system substrate-binding protein